MLSMPVIQNAYRNSVKEASSSKMYAKHGQVFNSWISKPYTTPFFHRLDLKCAYVRENVDQKFMKWCCTLTIIGYIMLFVLHEVCITRAIWQLVITVKRWSRRLSLLLLLLLLLFFVKHSFNILLSLMNDNYRHGFDQSSMFAFQDNCLACCSNAVVYRYQAHFLVLLLPSS